MSYTLEEALTCVGPGWYRMIKFLYSRLPEEVEVIQVKEKFGTLRIYLAYANMDLLEYVDKLEEQSSHVCAECGQWKPMVRYINYWYYSLCDECLEKQNAI